MSENKDLTSVENCMRTLKNNRDVCIDDAIKAAHVYAKNCDVGDERVKAFEIYENLRTAGRVYG